MERVMTLRRISIAGVTVRSLGIPGLGAAEGGLLVSVGFVWRMVWDKERV